MRPKTPSTSLDSVCYERAQSYKGFERFVGLTILSTILFTNVAFIIILTSGDLGMKLAINKFPHSVSTFFPVVMHVIWQLRSWIHMISYWSHIHVNVLGRGKCRRLLLRDRTSRHIILSFTRRRMLQSTLWCSLADFRAGLFCMAISNRVAPR